MSTENLLRDRARTMRREPTEAERRMWRVLRGRRFGEFKFRRQESIGPYIVDFVCYERRLVIELDGSQHAENAYDRRRDAWFGERGYTVLRFWNADVMSNPEGVQHAVATRLGLAWSA
jgi:very-short-patch-repair endonuclease